MLTTFVLARRDSAYVHKAAATFDDLTLDFRIS
jgi:hypothetical protein